MLSILILSLSEWQQAAASICEKHRIYRLPLREELPQNWLQTGAGEGSEQSSLLLRREEGVAVKPTGVPLTLTASITKPVTVGQVFMWTKNTGIQNN